MLDVCKWDGGQERIKKGDKAEECNETTEALFPLKELLRHFTQLFSLSLWWWWWWRGTGPCHGYKYAPKKRVSYTARHATGNHDRCPSASPSNTTRVSALQPKLSAGCLSQSAF